MVNKGVEPLDLPLPAFVSSIYAFLLENRDERSRFDFISRLELPLGDEVVEDGVWSDEGQGESFLAAMEALEAMDRDPADRTGPGIDPATDPAIDPATDPLSPPDATLAPVN